MWLLLLHWLLLLLLLWLLPSVATARLWVRLRRGPGGREQQPLCEAVPVDATGVAAAPHGV